MKKNMQFVTFVIILGVFISIVGCVEESTAPIISPNHGVQTILPKGTISGKIYDRCTGIPIDSAKISVGFEGGIFNTISDVSGSFSFANVPAGSYKVIDGRSVPTGTYLLTISLVEYNKRQTETTKRYRDHYYYPVTITFTSLVPGDSLGVSGLVGAVTCSLATLSATIKGTVVDQNLQPVANAAVTIIDHITGIVITQTSTAADGSFIILNIESGISFEVHAKSADGGFEGMVLKSIPCNLPSDSLRTQVTLEQIMLTPVDDVAPFVTGITPENGNDVPAAGLHVVYKFSEPIKQTAYTRVDLGVGHGTIVDDITISSNGLKKSASAMPSTLTWNSTFTQLTLTPSGLVGSAEYSVDAAAAFGKLKDQANNALVNNALLIGDFEVLNFSTAGNTTITVVPELARRYVQTLYEPLDYLGGLVGLEWKSVPNARSYNIYRSVKNGSFELVRSNVFKLQDTVTSGALVNPQGATDPLETLTIQYCVRAVSADLVEGPASNSITVTDAVSPILTNTSVVAGTGSGAFNWLYTLQFSEPLTVSSAQTIANYSILNPDTVVFTINDADYLGYNTISRRYHVQLLVSTDLALPAGYSLKAGNNIIDLAGNSINANANVFVSSAPPTPTLLTPNNGATNVRVPSVLSWKAANGAQTYHLQVSTIANFATTVLDQTDITGTSYSVPNLTVAATYYWRISATNTIGTSGYSAVRNFQP